MRHDFVVKKVECWGRPKIVDRARAGTKVGAIQNNRIKALAYAARGGSWGSFVADSSFRNSWAGNLGRGDFGFRVVRGL